MADRDDGLTKDMAETRVAQARELVISRVLAVLSARVDEQLVAAGLLRNSRFNVEFANDDLESAITACARALSAPILLED